MTATYKAVAGGKVSVAFTFVAPSQVIIDTATSAAKYLHAVNQALQQGQPVDFGTLTDQQKLDIIDAHLLAVIQSLARTQHSITAQDAAQLAAAIEAQTKFI